MAGYRRLNRPSDQRRAILRGLVSALLWNGHIQTTEARAKEVRRIAEKLITLAMSENEGNLTVTKTHNNAKKQLVSFETRNDTAAKLHVRRQLMSYLYEQTIPRNKDESKSEYAKRTGDINHPLVEKLFTQIAPKYKKRAEEKGTGGGYTRILKMGPRRGDAADIAILELI